MTMGPKPIRKFIESFEESFGECLQPWTKSKGHIYTRYFKIHPGKKKYSDWDLICVLKDNIQFDKVRQILRFIESYKAFDSIGHFMTNTKESAGIGSHIAQSELIQVMGMIKNQQYAPFFDISIYNVKNRHVRRLFRQSFNKEFLSWSMLTAWRKIKNKNFIGVNSFVWINSIYILPYYSAKKDLRAILSTPEHFFKSKLREARYKAAVRFLTH